MTSFFTKRGFNLSLFRHRSSPFVYMQQSHYLGNQNSLNSSLHAAEDADEEKAKDSNIMDNKSVSKLGRIDSSRPGGAEEEVYLWLSQPVIGFVSKPYFSCRTKNDDGIIDPFTRYRFTWYRSRKYYLCNSENCINMVSRSNVAPEMKCQCLTCLQFGHERYSYFCSPECMMRGWEAHCKLRLLSGFMRRTHKITSDSTVHVQKKLPIDPSMTVEDLADLQVKRARNQKAAIEGWEKLSSDRWKSVCALTRREYTPTEADVGHKLKVEVTSIFSNSLVISTETKAVIDRGCAAAVSRIAPPFAKQRQWYTRNTGAPAPANRPQLTLTSYNMLADIYCRPELYTQCPLWALDWVYRRNRLKKQIDVRSSDLFCFQEVEKGQFEQFWLPEMKKRGYNG